MHLQKHPSRMTTTEKKANLVLLVHRPSCSLYMLTSVQPPLDHAQINGVRHYAQVVGHLLQVYRVVERPGRSMAVHLM